MKKTVSIIILLVILSFSCVSYAEVDFKNMSDEEITQIIFDAQNELLLRKSKEETGNVVFENNGISIYITGNHEIDNWLELTEIECVIVNNSDFTLVKAGAESLIVNGWSVPALNQFNIFTDENVKPGSRIKGKIKIKNEAVDINGFEDIKSIKLDFYTKTKNGQTIKIENVEFNFPS